MRYLVDHDEFGMTVVEDYGEVLNLLRKYTAYWCADKDFGGDTSEIDSLYNECIKNNDFEDIAQVYEMEISHEMCAMKKGVDYKIRRIF